MAEDSGRCSELYGQEDEQKADSVDDKLGPPDPVLDIYGINDPRAVSKGNRGF